MSQIQKKTKVIEGFGPDNIPYSELMQASEPVILKGLVKDWPFVRAGLVSNAEAVQYLKGYYNGRTVGTYFGSPDIGGKFFYNEDLSGVNFEASRVAMDGVLDQILTHESDENPPTFYIGSTTIDACLPGFREQNNLIFSDPMFEGNDPLASIWIGTATLVCAHYDAPNNIACCAAGHRRFTLFPPEQIFNLYPGPLEPTPGGQVISMADINNPDFEKYPRLQLALETAQVADLEPGDGLFYPSFWWHQVEAFDPFNVLINFWWNTSPKYMPTPFYLLKLALLCLRDRPEHEKQAWKHIFDYYIFGSADLPRAHLPENAHGELAPIDELTARKLRSFVVNKLNR